MCCPLAGSQDIYIMKPTNPPSLKGMFGNQRTADIVVSQCVFPSLEVAKEFVQNAMTINLLNIF
jgi:hypothetical protein